MTRKVILTLVTLPALLCAAPRSLGAQQAPELPGRADGRLWLEGYVTRLRMDAPGGPSELEGIGGRVLRPVSERAALGAFVSHAPARLRDTETWHLGAQADLFVLRRPAGPVDPVVSLAAGALFREEMVRQRVMVPHDAGPLFSTAPGGRMSFERRREQGVTLAPGLGARLRVAPGLALRSDVRSVVMLGGEPRHHLELTGGISVAR